VAKDPLDSLEKKSYSVHFFLVSALLVLVTAWSVWDEVETRRPWKSYQREFNRLEYQALKAKLDEAEQKLLAEKASLVEGKDKAPRSLGELEKEIAAEIARIEGSEAYQRAKERIGELDRTIRRVEQKLRFAKSEAEEYFYRWKHALREHEDWQQYKEKWLAQRALVAATQPELDRLTRERSEAKAELARLSGRIEKLERTKEELTQYRDALRERLARIADRPLEIKQVVLTAYDRDNFGEPKDRVDRCESCHVGIDKEPVGDGLPVVFSSHPKREELLGKHPPEKLGCTPCHRGQGAALRSPKQAHGYEYKKSKTNGKVVSVRESLEHWEEPMFEGDFIESSCPACHQTFEIAGADILNKAKLLFTELGCHGCHLTEGFEAKAKIGPDLRRIRAKVYPEWLVAWIENPKAYLPKTRMPIYRFSTEESTAIAAYLWQNSEPYELAEANGAGGEPQEGKDLVESVGCMGCHSLGSRQAGGYLAPMGYDLVPKLDHIASKTNSRWIFNWLKNPKSFRPTTKMPSLRLSDEEAADIAAYLATLGTPKPPDPKLRQMLDDEELAKRGRKLIFDYGCYSCHEIKGFEEASRIAPPLTEFGVKDPKVELYFGDSLVKGTYRVEFGSEAETWENWTFNKLKDPRIYADEVAESKMPDFGLSDENARALLVLLRSFTGRVAPEQYRRGLSGDEAAVEVGKNLVRTLNCIGCHVIDGRGGDIRKHYTDLAMAPPVLTGEGDKVQAGWLFRFVKKPITLRPWLKVRMPTFDLSDADATAIAQYFNALSSDKIPFAFFDTERVSEAAKAEGEKLFGVKGSAQYEESLKCDSCHPRGSELPEGDPSNWGPDLALARERLKPRWIERWLRNPQELQPGTRMPNFFYDYDYYDGKVEVTELMEEPEAKIAALRDYLMTMER